MMTEHTPGPWREDGDGFIYGPDREKICAPRCMLPDADGICEMDANARLIAAAPELLEVLADWGRTPGNYRTANWWHAWEHKRHAAIAKATTTED